MRPVNSHWSEFKVVISKEDREKELESKMFRLSNRDYWYPFLKFLNSIINLTLVYNNIIVTISYQ